MPEKVIGAHAKDILHQTFTKEGSLTVTYNTRDIVANTIGHVLAIPTQHAALWTYKNAFQNPSKELAEQLFDRYKDVPWKGDVLVRVGHASLLGDVMRFIKSHDAVRGRPVFGSGTIKEVTDVVARMLLLPSVVFSIMKAKLFRMDNYNPFTNVVTVFHPRLGVGMHEIGHAEFFNQMPHGKREAYSLVNLSNALLSQYPFIPVFGSIPVVTSFMEYKASQNAMRRFNDDAERMRESTLLEAGYGTYLMYDVMLMTFPFVPPNPLTHGLAATAMATVSGVPPLVGKLLEFGWTAGLMAGSAAGRLLGKLPYPGRRQRFGYIFEGKKPAQEKAARKKTARSAVEKPDSGKHSAASRKPQALSAHQVLVATAKPAEQPFVPEQRRFHTTEHENGKQKKHSNFNRVTF